MEEKREAIIHKIQSLLALKNTPTHVEEGLLAGKIARNLMDKYEISFEDIDIQKNKMYIQYIDMGNEENTHPITICMIALGEYCDIKCGRTKRWSQKHRKETVHRVFFGQKHDVEIGEYIFHLLMSGMERELEAYKNTIEYKKLATKDCKNTEDSFLKGIALSINNRLTKMIEERKASLATMSTTTTSLIVLKQAHLDKIFEQQYGRVKPCTTMILTENTAFTKGFSAGGNIRITQGVACAT